jgi:hypothetical protein
VLFEAFCIAEMDTSTTFKAWRRFLMRDFTSFIESDAKLILLEKTLSFITDPIIHSELKFNSGGQLYRAIQLPLTGNGVGTRT